MNALQLYQFHIPVKTNINLLEASDFQVQQMRSLSWACPHGRERTRPRPLTPGVPAGPQCCKGKAFPSSGLLIVCQHWIHVNAQLTFPTLPPSKISHVHNNAVVGFITTTSSLLSTVDIHWDNLLGN